ncbi:hypothetical protein VaNZ11_014213 [Volvox africanus]|uniref:Uncharacterized protein n=1 Tax=Volvox africanus TaxID=51714 RepID=A0ABQ5SIB9_9CHLO|nr:hypothetical protein VaNZ11_014213 [Volvox africanus]
MRKQLQRLQAEKGQQIAAVRREAAASQAEMEALREQLRLAQQQVAQHEDDLAAATTTVATAATITTPSAAADVDLQLVPPPSPFPTYRRCHCRRQLGGDGVVLWGGRPFQGGERASGADRRGEG